MSESQTAVTEKRRDWVQTNVMLPKELRNLLIASAGKQGRSMSAEIVVRLADSFNRPDIRPVGRVVRADRGEDAETEPAP